LSKNSPGFRFIFSEFTPPRIPLGPIELIEKMVQSPKWTVNGIERWYFHEALDACARSYFGLVKLPTGCLAGDTRILTPMSTNPTMKELTTRRIFPVISSASILGPRFLYKVGYNAHRTKKSIVVRVTFADGYSCKVTPDHKFRLTDGSYKQAQFLTRDDDVMQYIRKF